MQGVFEETENKRSKLYADSAGLNAISNVQWNRRLEPTNDRDTQRQMADHRAREARYDALDAIVAAGKPKVVPYPNSPDRVFPATPCYKILCDGVYRFIFVVDLDDPLKSSLYEPQWNGNVRAQSTSYWIVPHFIYRRETDTTACKKRYQVAYDIHRQAGVIPPRKDSYDSTHAALTAYGIPLPPWYVAGLGFPDDSFYAEGQSNINVAAPAVCDPLFVPPFYTHNNLPRGGHVTATYRIRPYPYKQPTKFFPQQPDPPADHAIPAILPGPGGGVPGPGPAPGGVGPAPGGVMPAIPAAQPPHPSELEALDPTYSGLPNVDWIETNDINFEISKNALRSACEQAEELDYMFALNVQGLRGGNISSVWKCIDPEYDISDRSTILAQFVKMYMEKFYSQINAPAGSIVEDVIEEALHLHEEFCNGWMHKHHRTLAPEVSAAAESLVGTFFNELKNALPFNVSFTRMHLARYFRRKSEYSGEFATCLYHYMTSLEQMRGNRNASYRAMQTERVAYISSMKRMANLLQEKFNDIKQDLQNQTNISLLFDVNFIDWHYISSQLPTHHKDFDGYAQNFSFFRNFPGAGRSGRFPPWQQMRM